VAFVAIDEAPCISQWGHDFRPEYRQLGRLRAVFPGVRLHAFTATATARVRSDIVAQLALQDPVELVGSFDRPNLIFRVLARAQFKRQLADVLARHPGQAGIVYCPSRREVDGLAAWLSENGVRARPYHAGLPDGERSRNQDAFLEEHADVVVATVAFGMGIDRPDVRFVVHAGAPQSLEHYQQESGRAGRTGGGGAGTGSRPSACCSTRPPISSSGA
jgi:ATP-dependent DNA helicase RecQ